MGRLVIIACAAALLVFWGEANAAFDDDDNSGFKVTVKSLPFFGDEDEDDSYQYNDYDDPSDTEYTYDATGRKVPVRTD